MISSIAWPEQLGEVSGYLRLPSDANLNISRSDLSLHPYTFFAIADFVAVVKLDLTLCVPSHGKLLFHTCQ
jgi:hypothetical protein